MLTREQKKQRKAVFLRLLAEIKQLTGRPPVLSSEDPQGYDHMMLQFITCFSPRNFMDQQFIKDLTDATWEMLRYSRHQTVHLERKGKQLLENRLKAAAQQKQATGGASAEGNSAEVPAPLQQAPTELDHAEALERGIDCFTHLDQLRNLAMAKRNDILWQLEHYREGLAKNLLCVTDKMLQEHRPDPFSPPTELGAEFRKVSAEVAEEFSELSAEIEAAQTSPLSGARDEPPRDPSGGDEHGAG
jgi:hypothetical protein